MKGTIDWKCYTVVNVYLLDAFLTSFSLINSPHTRWPSIMFHSYEEQLHSGMDQVYQSASAQSCCWLLSAVTLSLWKQRRLLCPAISSEPVKSPPPTVIQYFSYHSLYCFEAEQAVRLFLKATGLIS